MNRAEAPVEEGGDAFKKAFFRFDWAATPLGPPSSWPPELHHPVQWMLDTVQPMFLVWGDERLLLFNNAYCSILGPRFNEALAAPLPELWSSVWDEVGPYIDAAFAG